MSLKLNKFLSITTQTLGNIHNNIPNTNIV